MNLIPKACIIQLHIVEYLNIGLFSFMLPRLYIDTLAQQIGAELQFL